MRRMLMAMVVLAVLATAGVSGAQTTTTSTSASTSTSSSTSTSTTSTTMPSTTTTTVVVPPIPGATLSGASGQVAGEMSSSCWPLPTGETACGIVDYIEPGPNPPTLAVTQGEVLTLRFDPALAVATLTAGFSIVGPPSRPGPALDLPASNPSSFRATMAPGTYLIGVTVTFSAVPAGHVGYFFQIRVSAPVTTVRPAQPVPAGRLSLTG